MKDVDMGFGRPRKKDDEEFYIQDGMPIFIDGINLGYNPDEFRYGDGPFEIIDLPWGYISDEGITLGKDMEQRVEEWGDEHKKSESMIMQHFIDGLGLVTALDGLKYEVQKELRKQNNKHYQNKNFKMNKKRK